MKYETLLPFIKEVQHKSHIPLCLVATQDESILRYSLKLLSQKNQQCIENPDTKTLYETLFTPSLFREESRLIYIFTDQMPKELSDMIEGYLKRPREELSLILLMKKISPTSGLFKKVENEGILYFQAELKPWEKERFLLNWLQFATKAEGVHLQDDAAHELIECTQMDLMGLKLELDKLILYTEGKKVITKADVRVLCLGKSHSVWQFADACLKRNSSAFFLAKELLDQGQSSISLITVLRNQYQNLLEMSECLRLNYSQEEIALQFPQMKKMPLDQLVQNAHKFNENQVQQKLMFLSDMEMKLKSSSVDEEPLIDHLICQLINN